MSALTRPECDSLRGAARLAAQVGMAAFDRASRRWAGDPAVDLGASIAQAADEVLTLGGT